MASFAYYFSVNRFLSSIFGGFPVVCNMAGVLGRRVSHQAGPPTLRASEAHVGDCSEIVRLRV